MGQVDVQILSTAEDFGCLEADGRTSASRADAVEPERRSELVPFEGLLSREDGIGDLDKGMDPDRERLPLSETTGGDGGGVRFQDCFRSAAGGEGGGGERGDNFRFLGESARDRVLRRRGESDRPREEDDEEREEEEREDDLSRLLFFLFVFFLFLDRLSL